MDTGPVCRTVCLFTPQLKLQYQIILLGDRSTFANNYPTVAFDSAAAGIEPAISNRKSNVLTTPLMAPSHEEVC